MNLQRDFIWTNLQKESLIESIILKRFIPPLSVILTVDDVYQIIDGKQRLSTLINYLEDGFTYCGYFYNELPQQYKNEINKFFITSHMLFEDYGRKIPDKVKIEWFKWINFSGTIQDEEHMNRLEM